MKSNSRVLRGWRDFGVKATAIILTILLATQMVGTPAFASGALTNKQASEDIATTVDDTGVEPSGTEATDTTVPDEAAGAANEPAPADSTQATEEPVVETVESATEPATETPAADPAANAVLGTEPAPAPAPAVEQGQLAFIKLNLADGASITLSKDGNKIDDDTNPVDVPANEELKFTAQAAEGWQVDKVKTVIDDVETELTADANGEYTIAAEGVTDGLTVKVETSAVGGEIPSEGEEAPAEDAAETGDEESTDPAAVEGENVTEEGVTPESIADTATNAVKTMVSEISLFAAGDESDAVEVTLKSVDGKEFGSAEISLGDLATAGATVTPEGFEYAYARVNNTDVKSVHYDAATSQYYVVTDEGQLAGIAIEDTEQIVLYFTPYAPTYNVAYEVYVKDASNYHDEYKKVDNPLLAVDFIGATTVKAGSTYEFSLTPKDGYSLRSQYGESAIEVTSGTLGDAVNNVYKVEGIEADTTIRVYLDKTSSYDFRFHDSSNTVLKLNGENYKSGSGDHTLQYNVGGTLEFDLYGYNQHGTPEKVLNKLILDIGDITNVGVNLPMNEDVDSATTELADGMTVTVTRTDERGDLSNIYHVSIVAAENSEVTGNVAISVNFKDYNSSEVWAIDLVGVDPVYAYQEKGGGHNGYSENTQILNPSEHVFLTRSSKYDTNLFIKVQDGYIDSLESLRLTVIIDGVDVSGNYSLKELTRRGSGVDGGPDAWQKGYRYYFTLSKDSQGFEPKDIRISVSAQSEAKTYAVQFAYDDGTASVTTANNLRLGDNFFVSDGKDSFPTKEGCVFSGWQLGDTVYNPGAIFSITDQTESLAQEALGGVYYFTFTPAWEDAELADTALYTVNVFFANEEGDYSDDPTAHFSESGIKGEEAFILTAELNERLAERAESSNLPENWNTAYVIDYTSSTPGLAVHVSEDGTSVINIYFQQKVTVTFEPGSHAADGEEATSVEVAKNRTVPTGQIPDFEAAENYEFAGWSSDGGETVLTDEQVAQQVITGDITFTAQWKQKIYNGDPITIQVVKDGTQVSAEGVITVGNWKDGTRDFEVKLEGNVYKVTYTYDNLNCADIELDVKVPTGYEVSVESNDMDVDPGVVDETEKECVIDGSGASWTLDNVPGGATVTVTLTPKDDATYTVFYKEQGTEKELASPDTVTGLEFASTHEVSAKEITGYTAVEPTTATATAGYDDADPRTNTVTFYYTANFSDFSIVGNGESWTYDSSTRYIGINGVYPGDTITYDFGEGKVINATVNREGAIEGAPQFKNVDDSATVTVTVERGGQTASASATMTISPREVIITTGSAAKVFDGTALTAENYEITSGSFVDGETFGVDFGDSGQIAPGASDNLATVVFAGEDNQYIAQANNYSVTVVPGTLLVYPQSIDPEDPDPENPDPDDPSPDYPDLENPDQPFYNGVKVTGPKDVDYNGLSQQLPPTVTDRNDNPLDPNYYDVAYSDDTVNAGTVTITVTGKNGYTGEVQVTYQINKVGLTITTPDAGKVYDGTPLQNQIVQADGWKDNDASRVTLTANGSITEVGSTLNTYVATDLDNVLRNYIITEDLGTLTVWPQSIDPTDPSENPDPDDPDAPDPSDPDPDFPGEDPDPDNPVVPDQPFYTGAEVNAPQDVPYSGADQTWAPTVTDAEGNLLTAGEDYEVSYSTDDRTNVTGDITVTITGKGNYAGTITREYQITPLDIDVYIENQTKVEGEADPTFTFNYEGVLEGESMGWTGAFVRDAGEAAGTYNVAQGGFVLADNEAGNFLASNYTLTVHPGTLTITAAPVPPGPDGPDTPVTPVTPLPTPDPTPVPTPTPGDPGATETTTTPATEEATETIEDDATPRTAPEPIDDDATPLASGAHRDCWVHWLMLLGILVTVVYYGGVGVRRVRFSSSLQSFEDDVLGNDETNR